MKRTWLVLDGNYLCWRTFHTTGRLTNGVVFGLLKSVQYLTEQFATPHVVFCFDHGKGHRETIFPGYKSARRDRKLSEDETEQIADMRRQVENIKTKVLKDCGFANVFYQEGYEADDVCAAVVEQLRGDDLVLVSADRDLLQLLDGNVCLWDPTRKHCHTDKLFRADYGIDPDQWRRVKAIAGCSTDSVPGVRGVGESTAATFLRGELGEDSVKYQKIAEFLDTPQYQVNLSLVSLPLPGLTIGEVSDKTVTQRGWNRAVGKHGMKSLKGNHPGNRGVGFGIKPKV